MTLRASSKTPSQALDEIKDISGTAKVRASNQAANYAANGGDADSIFTLIDHLRRYRADLLVPRSTPGLVDHAKVQESDAVYEIVTETDVVIALIETAVSDIISTFPVDGNGYLLSHTINAQGQRSARPFSAAALSGVIASLQAIDTAIS